MIAAFVVGVSESSIGMYTRMIARVFSGLCGRVGSRKNSQSLVGRYESCNLSVDELVTASDKWSYDAAKFELEQYGAEAVDGKRCVCGKEVDMEPVGMGVELLHDEALLVSEVGEKGALYRIWLVGLWSVPHQGFDEVGS